jgi:hypothetical protein
MRAQACIKCREYLIIHPDNPVNKELLEDFKAKHRSHTLITVQYEEIKGQYEKYDPNESQESSSSASAQT